MLNEAGALPTGITLLPFSEEGKMKRNGIFLMGLLLFFCLPSPGFADCAPLGRMDRWVVQEDGSIAFYAENTPLGTVELEDCTVNSSSVIQFLAPSVCDGDEILVNGERCMIASLNVPES
jgi:hypothetical protein